MACIFIGKKTGSSCNRCNGKQDCTDRVGSADTKRALQTPCRRIADRIRKVRTRLARTMRSDGNPRQTGDLENPPNVQDINCPQTRMGPDPRKPSRPVAQPPHKQAGHKTVPDLRLSKLQKALATQEPSTQDISVRLKTP